MYRLLLFLSISWEVIHSTRGEITDIKGVFWKGSAYFQWTPGQQTEREIVYAYLDREIETHELKIWGNYTQQDLLKYTTVGIIVRTYFPGGTQDSKTYYFNIPKVIRTESGKDTEINIPLEFVPATGGYSIKNDDKNIDLFTVQGNTASSKDTSRYIYVSKSDTEPKSITIKIKSVTTEDAGYIYTSASEKQAQNGPGIVLVVTGSPTKPTIAGEVDVPVGEGVTLTCESKSTSAPSYYKMLPPLTYSWYRNDTEIKSWSTSNQLTFRVEKRYKYDTITCISREEINSVRSAPIRLNPQYGPDAVNISPEITDTVDVIQGKKFGPYTCSADCNPPCKYQWKRIKLGSQYEDVGSGPILTISQVDKTHADKYRCRADSSYKNSEGLQKATKTVTLRVLYLSEPVVYAQNSVREKLTIKENVPMKLSCKVEGVPRPSVSILRKGNSLSTGNEWSNYTFTKGPQCDDTGHYTCRGKSKRFNETEKSFFINVTCSPRLGVASYTPLYGSQIGHKVTVTIPVISNPKPTKAIWKMPAEADADIRTRIKEGPVVYKYEIESEILIKEQSDFGNYTLLVGGTQLTAITINAEGPPFKPSNFSGISEIQGQINLTWISTFNGGPEQFFLLKQNINSKWQQIKNISDIGQGRQMSVVVEETVAPGVTYEFMLQSCNRINCSAVIRSAPIKAQEIPTYMGDTGSSGSTVAVAASSVAVVIVLVVVVVGVLFKFKTKSQEKTPTGIPYTPPEVVYATVDKGNVNNATIKGDISVNTKETNDTGETENMYANTDEALSIVKKSKPERPANPPKKKKKSDKKKKAEETAPTPNNTSRTVNEDGLIYIDVDFTNKPQETQDPPVIHGEEDRTEYTFVDFSKKAPPVEDTSDDEQNEEKKDDV